MALGTAVPLPYSQGGLQSPRLSEGVIVMRNTNGSGLSSPDIRGLREASDHYGSGGIPRQPVGLIAKSYRSPATHNIAIWLIWSGFASALPPAALA